MLSFISKVRRFLGLRRTCFLFFDTADRNRRSFVGVTQSRSVVRRRNRGECVLAVLKETFDDVSSRRKIDDRRIRGWSQPESEKRSLKLLKRFEVGRKVE